METRLCSLSVAVGNDAECPGAWCAFWEKGGAVVEAGCAIERLGIDVRDPALAGYLLEVRRDLEEARDAEAAKEAHDLIAVIVPPDISGS
jgi:hypothetical protein